MISHLWTQALFSRAQCGAEGITATCRAPPQAVSLGLQYSRDRRAHLLGGSNPEYTPHSFIHSFTEGLLCAVLSWVLGPALQQPNSPLVLEAIIPLMWSPPDAPVQPPVTRPRPTPAPNV